MNAKKTPLQQVNEDHGGKTKLVDSILGLVDLGDESKDEAKARLLKASNKKLLRLQANSAAIQDRYGSVEKLVHAVAEKLGRVKDSDFVGRLKAFSPAKLLDLARSLAGEARKPFKALTGKLVPSAKAEKAAAKAAAKPAKKAAGKKPAAKPAKKAPAAKAKAKAPAKKSPSKK